LKILIRNQKVTEFSEVFSILGFEQLPSTWFDKLTNRSVQASSGNRSFSLPELGW
jgi:hypothetical protein